MENNCSFKINIMNLFVEVEVNHFGYVNTTQSGGVTISNLKVTPAPLRKNVQLPATLEHHTFIPYNYAVSFKIITSFLYLK